MNFLTTKQILMKIFISVLFALISSFSAEAQTINQITFLPASPTNNDTVLLKIDFTYQGNCSYGIVSNFVSTAGDTVYAFPTYCGYGDTSVCNRIDTISIGSFNPGNYHFKLEIHQGSICPLSGFDATLTQLDTTFMVSTFTGSSPLTDDPLNRLQIYPNPASTVLHVDINSMKNEAPYRILSVTGQVMATGVLSFTQNQIDLQTLLLKSGVYILETSTSSGKAAGKFYIE